MEIKKQVNLTTDVVDDKGNVLAQMQSILSGDGSTPVIRTNGYGSIIGYNDDGTVIVSENLDNKLKDAQQEFMAEAIKEQKKLSEANGIDPSVVNIIGAEKEGNTNE